MLNSSIVFNHHRLHFGRDHRGFGVRSGKPLYCFHRRPPGHDKKLDPTLDRAAQYRGIDEPRNFLERRECVPV
jgi:hypothetical protein